VLVMALLGATLTGVGLAARAEAPVAAPSPGKLSNLRVCGSTAFSRSRAQCTRDERRTTLVSNRISCSVDADVARPALIRPRTTYNGRAISFRPSRLPRGEWSYWINHDLKINLPLPGGTWGCSFTFGRATVRASFRSGGPTGAIVNTAACRGENTVAYDDGFRVCRSDESGAPLPGTNSAYCYAVYPNETGRLARLAVVSDGEVLQEVEFRIGEPLWIGVVFVSAPPGQRLPAGSYSCEYHLDGSLAAAKPFTLLG
jgi:hypothetical protein